MSMEKSLEKQRTKSSYLFMKKNEMLVKHFHQKNFTNQGNREKANIIF